MRIGEVGKAADGLIDVKDLGEVVLLDALDVQQRPRGASETARHTITCSRCWRLGRLERPRASCDFCA